VISTTLIRFRSEGLAELSIFLASATNGGKKAGVM
jgi:hypothetical protein